MKESIEQQLSSCLDGEMDQFSTRRVIGEVLNSDTHQQRFLRYQLIGDVLRDEVPVESNRLFASNILNALSDDVESEPDMDDVVSRQSSGWRKPVAGFALAASVTAISLVGLNSFNPVAPGVQQTTTQTLTAVSPAETNNQSISSSVLMQSNTVPVSTTNTTLKPSSIPAVATVTSASGGGSANIELTSSVTSNVLKMEQPFLRNYLATHTEYANSGGMLPQIRLVGYHSSPVVTDEQ